MSATYFRARVTFSILLVFISRNCQKSKIEIQHMGTRQTSKIEIQHKGTRERPGRIVSEERAGWAIALALALAFRP